MPHRTSTNKDWCKLTGDGNAGYEQSEENGHTATNKMLVQCPGSVSSLLSVSLFKFITWDRSQLVSLVSR